MNTVIVGCGNIGFEAAKLLCDDHSLVLINRSCSPELADWVDRREHVSFVPGDATNPQDMEAALSPFQNGRGRLDAMLSTVGAACSASALRDFDKFEEEFLLNVLGNLVPLSAALKSMRPRREGKLVVVSSTSGVFTYPGLTAYAPAKWAVTALCQTLRRETRQDGLSLSILFPRTIRNRRSRTFLSERGVEAEALARAAVRMLGRGDGVDRFVPFHYAALRPLEQWFPVVLDARAGLHAGRRKRFHSRRAKSVLITGAESGLGRELACLYGLSAERMCLADRRPEALREIGSHVARRADCAVDVIPYGASDKLSVQECARQAADVDLVINVVPCGPGEYFKDLTFDQCEMSLRAGFLGPARLIGALLARKRGPGKILNVLSASAVGGRPGCACWAAAHAAMWAFTRALRRTYGNDLQVMEAVVDRCPCDSGRGCNGDGVPDSAARSSEGALPVAGMATDPALNGQVAGRIVAAERAGREIVSLPLGLRLSTCCGRISRLLRRRPG